jgi:hypothetical protein
VPPGNLNLKYAIFSWIAAARIEEYDGKLEQARNLIYQGIE